MTNIFKNSLKHKLIILLLGISLVAVLSVGILTYFSAKLALENAFFNNLKTIAQSRESHLQSILRLRLQQVDMLAANELLQGLMEDFDRKEKGEKVDEVSLQKRVISFVDTELPEYARVTPFYDFIFLSNAGKVKFASEKELVGQDFSTDERFIRGQKEKIIVDMFMDEKRGGATYGIVAPIFPHAVVHKEAIGVIIVKVNPIIINALMTNREGMGESGETYIVNKAGLMISESRFMEDAVLKQRVDTEAVKLFQTQKKLMVGIYPDYRDISIVGASMGSNLAQEFPYLGWTILAEIDESEAFMPIKNLRNDIILILLLMSAGIFIIVIRVVKFIVNPIKQLSITAEKITQGDFELRAQIASEDEVGVLARSFNTMITGLVEAKSTAETSNQQMTVSQKKLQDNLTELEATKKATLNLLEDLDIEKTRLAAASAQLETILNNLPVGVMVAEINTGRPTMVNNAAIDILGKGVDPKATKESYGIVYSLIKDDGTPYPSEELPLAITVRTGESVIGATGISVKKTDGTILSLRASSVMVKDKNGRPVSCVVIFEDMTKEKQIDKAKTEFVSLASHQLRTPLSTVNWYTEMLLAGDAGKINKEQKKYLDEIYHGNQRMVELVNALLNVSRLELGTFTIEPEPTDIVVLAKSAIDEQKHQIDEKKLKFSDHFNDDIPKINADPKLLRMVFQNLLSNAVKYTPEEGNIEFAISYDQENKSINIKVTDTGYGIPKNQQDKIFTKLFRADNVREKDTEGTGLGLYIVKSIIEQTGGAIRFESEENKGTTFYISLPITGMQKKTGTKQLE